VIALLGDTHLPRGSRRLPVACIELLQAAGLILHTGDFTAISVLRDLEHLGTVRAVHGNIDEPELRAMLPARLVVEYAGLRIGLVHSGGARTGRHQRLRSWFPDCDLIAYGHSHQPELAQSEGTWIVNPGSPTDRRRAPSYTMAVVEEGSPRLVDL
jgi:putative phosphoesterase